MKRYTPEEKAKILSHAAKHGVKAAREKFGVSQGSVDSWRKGQHQDYSPSTTSAPLSIDAVNGAGQTWDVHNGTISHAIIKEFVNADPEVSYLRRLLALRDQEIAMLREREWNGKP